MPQIKSVTFKASVDSNVRSGFMHATHATVHALVEDQTSGDSIEVEYDDGTVQDYMLDNAEIVPAVRKAASPQHLPKGKKHSTNWLKVHVKPGVVA